MARNPPESRRPRVNAVGENVRRLLALALTHDVNDPRLQRLTISEVAMSRDLKHATVYVIRAEPANAKVRAEIEAGFSRSTAFFRSVLAERGGLRYVPKLKFILDETADQAERIERLLQKAMSRSPSS